MEDNTSFFWIPCNGYLVTGRSIKKRYIVPLKIKKNDLLLNCTEGADEVVNNSRCVADTD